MCDEIVSIHATDAEYLTGYEIMIIPFTSSCGGLERMVTISDISKVSSRL